MRYILLSLLLFSRVLYSMEEAYPFIHSERERIGGQEHPVLLPPTGRLKKATILALKSAQESRYGIETIDQSIQEIIDRSSLDPSLKESLSFKQMNEQACNTLELSQQAILGMKSLLGQKTIWINQKKFLLYDAQTQNYLLAKAVSETDYCNPELNVIVASELCGISASHHFFQKAKHVAQEMVENKSQEAMNPIKGLVVWKDTSGLTRVHPYALKAAGMAAALVVPLLILPTTPLEKKSFLHHSNKSIVSSSASEHNLNAMKLVGQANFNQEDTLSDDELRFLKTVIDKRSKQLIENEIQHTLQEKHASQNKQFNFYRCVHACQDKECDCKELFLEHEEYKKIVDSGTLFDWCTADHIQCVTACHRKALKNPKNITKPNDRDDS